MDAGTLSRFWRGIWAGDGFHTVEARPEDVRQGFAHMLHLYEP